MTSRLCKCGCGQILRPRVGEKPSHFARRKYRNHTHAERAQTRKFKARKCACGQSITRRRHPNGRLETPANYLARKACDVCVPPLSPETKPAIPIKPAKKTATLKRSRTASKPKSLPKPVKTPAKPTQRHVAPVNRPLPDPRKAAWQTVAPAKPANPCSLHPTESAAHCTLCALPVHHQTAKVGNTTPVWKRI